MNAVCTRLLKLYFLSVHFDRVLVIDLLTILQKSLDRATFDRVALELRSQLCTFENSINCDEISFNPHSFCE